MRLVVQNDKNRVRDARSRSRGRGLALGCGAAVLASTALVTGCSDAGSPAPRPAAGQGGAAAHAPDARAARAAEHARLVAAAKRWGLDEVPLSPPPPPAKKPRITARAGFEVDHQEDWDLPPVFTTVPTADKVVFLTIDDGSEKDPRFLEMMRDLKIPYTAFLSDYLVKDDYGYFRKAQSYGNSVNNHTLHHPYLPGLSYDEQRHEICDMQDIMQKQYGKRPTLFRPPYGNYNQDTLVAAKSCGIKYAPIWNEEVYVDHWEFREDDQQLRRGDIVLTHFRGRGDWDGTMVDDMRRFLNKVTREGYAVARLEDYL
ncbi:polysaccharide deacetylase family protein [Streptomyces sp. NEAU-sy36]|uniref:polysaccharide deacetylase family protein n=1 Tax=unclassified Streptomyces TaxID=2593676 RepID=UPI0015D607F8|nr:MULTISPECIES: polysaccharide deacetylase family protein [unclassified Streptomyces]QLJ05386.1 polysaccharide deacetylase family protein [Streptomyces sp. NEAU-sy36]